MTGTTRTLPGVLAAREEALARHTRYAIGSAYTAGTCLASRRVRGATLGLSLSLKGIQMARALAPDGYDDLLRQLKERIQQAQLRAVLVVNRELVLLYWQIGCEIVTRIVTHSAIPGKK